MKNFILLLIFAVLTSCSNDDNDVSSKNNLKGKWNWILTSGGFGGPQTSEQTKQKKIIEFSGTSLKTYINGNLSMTQEFSIQTKSSIFGGMRKVIVIEKGNSDTAEAFIDQSFEIIGNKLYLRQECVDCATSEYERIK